MPKYVKTINNMSSYNSGLGMVIDAHDGYLWVTMWVAGPKDMVGHGNGAWGDTGGRCG